MTLHLGDCLEVMASMPAASVDTVLTDPPYGLEFMGKDWDHGIPGEHFWTEALRVAKPGAMLLAFGGTRTFHRLTCAIEDAGWKIRDCIMWVYGSGFPKSLDISKAIDKEAGAEPIDLGPSPNWREAKRDNGQSMNPMPNESRLSAPATDAARLWHGWGTALKPAWEPIIVAMKPCDGTFAQNAEKWGVSGMWIDGARVGMLNTDESGWSKSGSRRSENRAMVGPNYARDPRPEAGSGRWPANLIHDGSEEAIRLFPSSSSSSSWRPADKGGTGVCFTIPHPEGGLRGHDDAGNNARFFYCAKASRAEREAGLREAEAQKYGSIRTSRGAGYPEATRTTNDHPTVKPLALMRYLARLTKTPTGGVVLDPFMGSGSTGVACVQEGRDFIGIEIDPHYHEIARKRIEAAQAQPVLQEAPW